MCFGPVPHTTNTQHSPTSLSFLPLLYYPNPSRPLKSGHHCYTTADHHSTPPPSIDSPSSFLLDLQQHAPKLVCFNFESTPTRYFLLASRPSCYCLLIPKVRTSHTWLWLGYVVVFLHGSWDLRWRKCIFLIKTWFTLRFGIRVVHCGIRFEPWVHDSRLGF